MSARLGLASVVREGDKRVCPLIDFARFTEGYPKEVGMQEAGELRGQLSKLAVTIINDINLCGTPMPPSQGTAVSTNQS
jgi:hypothetical protein